jgi:uncharacterized protein (TIGR03382 family)
VTSTDENVFSIEGISRDGHGFMTAHGVARGEGTARIVIRDSGGGVVGSGEAEVLAPDQIVLESHAYLIMDRDDEAPVDDLRIISGGTATYHVRYFRGGRELHGNGVLSVDSASGVTAQVRQSFLFENREWLSLTMGSTPGVSNITMAVDGTAVETMQVTTVSEADIEDMVVIAQSEAKRREGEWLVLLAQSYDAAGRRILGIEYTWQVDGAMQLGDGDLYRYKYAPGLYHMVTAKRGGHTDSVMIQSEGGFVDSSNEIGCSTTTGSGACAMLGVIGFAVLRRRRRPA